MKRAFVGLALTTVLVFLLCGCGPHGARNGFYQGIQIGPDGTITPEGQRTLFEPLGPGFFDYFRGSFVISIEHRVRPVQSAPALNAFYLEAKKADARLDRTVKTSELLRGDFGSISLSKTCFYNRSFDFNLDTLAIGLRDGRPEPAKLVNPPTARNILRRLRCYVFFVTGMVLR